MEIWLSPRYGWHGDQRGVLKITLQLISQPTFLGGISKEISTDKLSCSINPVSKSLPLISCFSITYHCLSPLPSPAFSTHTSHTRENPTPGTSTFRDACEICGYSSNSATRLHSHRPKRFYVWEKLKGARERESERVRQRGGGRDSRVLERACAFSKQRLDSTSE